MDVEAQHERDGLCANARALELAGVPLLFGLGRGIVREIPAPAAGFGAFEVTGLERGTSAVTRGLLGGAGVFVAYPFVDRMLSERGWPMTVVNGIVAAFAVGAMVILMYMDTQM